MARKHRAVRQSGHTVLLVDDDADYLEATRLLLESEGHRVVAVASGPEALAVLRAERVDVALLDYFMPGMTGEAGGAASEGVRRAGPGRAADRPTATQQPPREMLSGLTSRATTTRARAPEKFSCGRCRHQNGDHAAALGEESPGTGAILGGTHELHRVQPLVDLLA